MSNELAERHEQPLAAHDPVTPMQMVQSALERGVDGAQLEKLLDLQQRWEAHQARNAYVQAMAAFKAEPLKLSKDRQVSYSGTKYQHASLAAVVDAVVAAMSKHGLSHRWETQQDGSTITVSCVITHEFGHSEQTTLSAGPDTSGSKNSIQAVGSTVTYLQRYTLMAATGLAAHDMDDDGNAGGAIEYVTKEHVDHLEKLIKEAKVDRSAYLKTLEVEKLEELPKRTFQIAKVALQTRIQNQKAGASDA